MLFTKVLIPVDGSELGDRVLSLLDRFPHARELEVVLTRTIERPGGAPPRPDRDDRDDDAFAHLYGLEERLRERGIRATHLVSAGDPAERILEAIRAVRPSLVAMSTHGRGGASRALRGSVAEAVLERCPVPLLLGSPSSLPLAPGAGFARILVPLDGSDVSGRIIPFVAALALHHGSAVVLLHVGDDTERARQLLRPYRQNLERAGVDPVEAEVAPGDPAAVILAEATRRGADLIALTSHSQTEGVAAWLGSVADRVGRESPVPLLVVRVAQPAAR